MLYLTVWYALFVPTTWRPDIMIGLLLIGWPRLMR